MENASNTGWESYSAEELRKLLDIFSKNWLAMDGVWFQAVESRYGMDVAMDCDVEIWGRFSKIEADRIRAFLGLEDKPGLEGLARALKLRMYAALNRDEIIVEGNTLTYRVLGCRVQNARSRKGMELHPCKRVGEVEYSVFAKAIDPRLRCEVISCYPDITDDSCNCSWQFTLEE